MHSGMGIWTEDTKSILDPAQRRHLNYSNVARAEPMTSQETSLLVLPFWGK